MLASLIKALPAVFAVISAIVGLIRDAQSKKQGKDEAIIDGLAQAKAVLDKMAKIAASPSTDKDAGDALNSGNF